MPQKLKVLVVGQTPPPFGGQSIMIERFIRTDLQDVQLLHARMGFSSHMNEVGRVRFYKVLHLFTLIAKIYYYRIFHRVRILYYPPAGPDRVPMYRDLAILLATRWMFAKTIFHYHAGGLSELYDRLPRWQRWLFRRAYYDVDAAIRISELTPEDGKLLECQREFVVPNGIDDPNPLHNLPLTGIEVTESRPLRILFVGILRESKGLLVLVEACGLLAARGVPFHLEVMGQPHTEEFLALVHRRIDELQIRNQVHFLGVLTGDQKFAAYARADVFCMPSFFNCETFGIVFLEAMAFGLPVVATRWRGIPSIVDDDETGFLVDIHDSESVADRLTRLAVDGELWHRMSIAARRKFEREYTWPRHAARMRQALLATAGVAVRVEPISTPVFSIPSDQRARYVPPYHRAHGHEAEQHSEPVRREPQLNGKL
jgi:glycosyltransferase involved in cell wall biosynthesis